MNSLTLAWYEAGHLKTWQLSDQTGTVRLGRDPSRCTIVLSHPTVSGMHVEIEFQPQRQQFILRNLRASNPPLINGKLVAQDGVSLAMGDQIMLGDLMITVQQCQVTSSMPKTYGLQCPRCQRISSYDHLDLGCPWCGTSLASAASMLLP